MYCVVVLSAGASAVSTSRSCRAVICLYSNVMYGVYLRMYSRKHVRMSYLSVSFTGYCMRGAGNLHCLAHSPFHLCFHTVK